MHFSRYVHEAVGWLLMGNFSFQDSIRASKDWFMACAPHAAGMAAMMADHMSKAASYDSQLHVLYLANDVLLKGCA